MGFVEASGYSQTDLSAAYQRGFTDGGGESLQGNAYPENVLESKTFSSAVAGVNARGTMPDRGIADITLGPGDSTIEPAGYYSAINIEALPMTTTHLLNSSYVDLGADNRVRYINAQTYAQSQYNSGKAQGVSDAFTNVAGSTVQYYYKGSIEADTAYLITGLPSSYSEDTLLILVFASSKVNSLSTQPSIYIGGTLRNYLVFNAGVGGHTSSSRVDQTVYIAKIPAGTTGVSGTFTAAASCNMSHSITELSLP